MSGTGSSSSWSGLLSSLSSANASDYISSEEAFHRRFKEHCQELREREPQRMLSKFLRYHQQIMVFVRQLDAAMGHDERHGLSFVFWTRAFEVVEQAFRDKEQKGRLVRENWPKLGTLVPAFGPNLPLFTLIESVQAPLQSIFQEYMDCYGVLLQLVDSQDKVNHQSFIDRTSTASASIATLKTKWESAVTTAQRDAETRRRRESIGTASTSMRSSGNSTIIDTSFEKLHLLGRGANGYVYKVREKSTGSPYAMKQIVLEPGSRGDREAVKDAFRREVDIMKRLRHHHIASVQFETMEVDVMSIYMSPVADYDLSTFMEEQCVRKGFPAQQLTNLTTWFGCLISALFFAHNANIKHEDIKPSNILVKDNQVYLSDFGSARDFSGLDSSHSADTTTVGTPLYWPPEPQRSRNRRSDVWSLGCVFSEMLTVRQKKSLSEFRRFRKTDNQDYVYAFKHGLDKVQTWVRDIVPANDEVGLLLRDHIVLMLEPDNTRRKDSKEIKKTLRFSPVGEITFCTTCYN